MFVNHLHFAFMRGEGLRMVMLIFVDKISAEVWLESKRLSFVKRLEV
jgi:hypothetical protein